jgi:propanol-preferring alcohol dehydrogenase
MGNTMKAAVVRELGKPLAFDEVPVPQPNENQILVRIAATGICHTDLHAAKGDWPVKPKPAGTAHTAGPGGRRCAAPS